MDRDETPLAGPTWLLPVADHTHPRLPPCMIRANTGFSLQEKL